MAALAGVWGRYNNFYRINFVGTQNLVEVARKYQIKKFVFTSTPSVVFRSEDLLGVGQETPYPEKHITAYAKTKTKTKAEKLVLAAQAHVLAFEHLSPGSAICGRPLSWDKSDP